MASTTSRPTIVLQKHRSPHPFFTPTHLTFADAHAHATAAHDKVEDDGSGKRWSWSSRRARKGRYSPKVSKVHYIGPSSSLTQAGGASDAEKGDGSGKKKEAEVEKMERIAYGRMKAEETKFKPHLKADVTFWLAVTFTLGSAVWVVNGYLVWFPIIRPELDTTAFTRTAAATAFIGGSIFEVGAYLGVVEALDRGREINFGTALGQVLHHRRRTPSHAFIAVEDIKHDITHVHSRSHLNNDSAEGHSTPSDEAVWPAGAQGFIWWGKPLWHDMGYLAAFVQLIAATVFWVSTLTGLPGVIPGFSDGEGSPAIIDVFFWTPQVVGGTGFIISSLILMIEVQKKWWLPNLTEIGWWVAVWNLVGAIGFTLCGALGYSSSSGAVYQSGLSTFWGSWAFLLGSGCQLYEAIWREP
ncbi:hypothetical protein I317_05149 [Kwoniella heveanensis CBS 569]|uniref:Integral membrane protein n=1 Tax=Kwoniella heveanensis BCC8398 TaxID=1296120 RepID=A0A1B9GV35_9TREE|nr:hypothetical protein I316_03447 [Kwoniella heveanensis BCC8398]OCF41038.1 hypothetical protein I317_05149 [Kwoniella heveanensis CBS 569]